MPWIVLQFIWPISGPITLTGSYGEIRGQTFHTGIDISVGEKIGEVPVIAAGVGYVYRIRVSHTGFGRVIYVKHPQGLITVYGHLSHFAPKGEKIIQALQVHQRRFEVEKYLTPDEWPVNAGDTLGWAGNSGYSFGPHLHFEVRTLSDKPLCPLRYLPPYSDKEPPVFFRLAVKPLGPSSAINGWAERRLLRFRQVSLTPTHRLYMVRETLSISGTVGIDFTAADRMGGGSAWL
ncbi:MAG: M23 family metallopeptidase, partial [Bacteroidia bacterium]|nr:M23 family metallopeptidase [Bacteroidia bacterium]